jgi:hypothetical protein
MNEKPEAAGAKTDDSAAAAGLAAPRLNGTPAAACSNSDGVDVGAPKLALNGAAGVENRSDAGAAAAAGSGGRPASSR